MNGLDDGELWRTVGLLQGGTPSLPVLQTLTTSCHHCLEPACMLGCPVEAYEKDPVTGIVKHLDDQCIGCQYCVFMCPYDAPKYNAKRGIVRKCDLCSDRLAHGEAPACVQACPNEAIRVAVVAESDVVAAAQASAFVPGAAPPALTLPTTSYQGERALPRNLLPADFYAMSAEPGHVPLVVMLVLTQLSVGAFAVDDVARAWLGLPAPAAASALFALILGTAALGASVLHLGRPRYAFRALVGLRTSWLSREILGFSIFSAAAQAYAASCFVPRLGLTPPRLEPLVVLSGLLAVGCSVMVYVATRRESWQPGRTTLLFFGTAAVLGCATVLAMSALFGAAAAAQRAADLLLVATAGKLLFEAAIFRHLRQRRHTALKRTALVMARGLPRLTQLRFACGVAGGILLPALVRAGVGGAGLLAAAGLVFALAGELCERYLFFAATSAPRMPGGPA
jgi:Fe-S-cluster-containing dehydrogenase component/DMSO reductase anchor subunit